LALVYLDIGIIVYGIIVLAHLREGCPKMRCNHAGGIKISELSNIRFQEL